MNVTIAPRTGLQLKNPVMTASGTLGYGIEYASHLNLSRLGAIVCKGTTREPRTGNPPMRVWETAAGMLNAIGLQNVGIEAVVREKAPIWATWDTPVLVNVSGTSVEDYQYIAGRLHGVDGVSGIELNISCPNVKEGGVAFGTDPRLAFEVTRAVRAVTSLPLVVKLSPNVTDIRSIAAAVEEAGADAISLINTVYGMALDLEQRRPSLHNRSGGLSGPAIKPLALHLVYEVAQEVRVPIIGIGGIMNASDALEFMMAGATAVALGTALMVNPGSWQGVVEGIERWCRREGIRENSELTGAANSAFRGHMQKAGETQLAGF
jgi:dihydroorotate dehydrogenase (NAD+) catalytic subunit